VTLRNAMQEALTTFDHSPSSYDVTAAADSIWNSAALADQGSVQHDLAALAQAVRATGAQRLIDPPLEGHSGHFLLDTSVWRRVPALAAFAVGSALPAIARTLLGCGRVRYYDDQMFVKEAGAVDRTAFHQDFPYFHLDRPDGCVFWIPLQAVGRGGGRMGYIPGSHLWGAAFKPNIFVSTLPFPGSEGTDMPAIDEQPEAYGAEYIEVEPGDVIVHHFLTVHGAEGNRSNTNRAAFSLRYCDADVRYHRRCGAPAQPLHKAEAKDGDMLDNVAHPICVAA
jgi:ectoine hydroxylase-related dioxygenase (phytanoyl-CoA dioxygenase family)